MPSINPLKKAIHAIAYIDKPKACWIESNSFLCHSNILKFNNKFRHQK